MPRSRYFTEDYFQEVEALIRRLPPARRGEWVKWSQQQAYSIRNESVTDYLESVSKRGLLPHLAPIIDPRLYVRSLIKKHRELKIIDLGGKLVSQAPLRRQIRRFIRIARIIDLMIEENMSAADLLQAEQVRQRLTKSLPPGERHAA